MVGAHQGGGPGDVGGGVAGAFTHGEERLTVGRRTVDVRPGGGEVDVVRHLRAADVTAVRSHPGHREHARVGGRIPGLRHALRVDVAGRGDQQDVVLVGVVHGRLQLGGGQGFQGQVDDVGPVVHRVPDGLSS